MKPLVEFILACALLLIGGCSAVAGIINTSLITGLFAVAAIIGLILVLTHNVKNK